MFVGRSNVKRLDLGWFEVSLLEAVRCFDEWAEMSWDEALGQLGRDPRLGSYAPSVRSGPLLDAASAERGLGPDFLPRCRSLAAVVVAAETA